MNATDTPKALPIATPGEGTIAKRVAAGLGLRPTPLDDWHFSRLAIVYRSPIRSPTGPQPHRIAGTAIRPGRPCRGPGMAQGSDPASSTRTRGTVARRPSGEPDFIASWPKLPWIMSA